MSAFLDPIVLPRQTLPCWFPPRTTLVTPCHHTVTIHKRCRIQASERLYPEPSKPERIDNPVVPSPSSGDYLSRLGKSSSTNPTTSPPTSAAVHELFAPAARALWRIGWLSWWVQLTLTVVSAVIILFSFAFPGVNVRSSASVLGFVLAAAGVLVSFLSLGWTYNYTRLSLWLSRPASKLTPDTAHARITRVLRIGLLLAVTGLLISLTGLQAIVGTLLARLLSAGIASQPYRNYDSTLVSGPAVVQPVDVLVVQASANAMTALMSALIVTVWLRARAKKWGQNH